MASVTHDHSQSRSGRPKVGGRCLLSPPPSRLGRGGGAASPLPGLVLLLLLLLGPRRCKRHPQPAGGRAHPCTAVAGGGAPLGACMSGRAEPNFQPGRRPSHARRRAAPGSPAPACARRRGGGLVSAEHRSRSIAVPAETATVIVPAGAGEKSLRLRTLHA